METKRRIHKKCGNMVVSAIFVAAILTFALAPIVSAAGAGNALDFEGTNGYVNCGEAIDAMSAITIEAWVNPAQHLEWQRVVAKTYDGDNKNVFILGLSSTSGIYFGIFNTAGAQYDAVGATGIPLNDWSHIVGTWNGNLVEIYLNGVKQPETRVSYGNMNTNSGPVLIGRGEVGTHFPQPFVGLIDEVRIWDDARTEAEIRENMCKTLVGDESGLVAYYKMTDGSGTSLTDNSINSNTGTLTNMEDGDWVTSTAAIGDKSHYGAGTSNLAENGDVPVDIAWEDTPGANAIFDAIQVDAAPDVTTGLLINYPSTYWELWIANNESFNADVKFHYDDIGGIGKESALSLYTRSEADENWIAVTDITRDNEEDTTDGVGSITANNLTGFSQFIITSDDPVNPVPELSTLLLFSIGLLMLVGYVVRKRF